MPKRTNEFQTIVAIVHEHLFSGQEVEESAFLINKVTGERREVDVVVKGLMGGYPMVVSVEVRAGFRKADATWVEAMIGKHAQLPTDKLILFSRTGFYEPARRLAENADAIAISPKDLKEGDFVGKVVNNVGRLFPRFLSLTPNMYRVHMARFEDDDRVIRGFDDNLVFLDDETVVGTLQEVAHGIITKRMEAILEEVKLNEFTEDAERFFVIEFVGPKVVVDGTGRPMYLQFVDVDPPALHLIGTLEIRGQAQIAVSEVAMTHQRFGDALVSFGAFTISGKSALLVVTENESGGTATMRFGVGRPVAKASNRKAARESGQSGGVHGA